MIIRNSYKGGFTYLNPIHQNKTNKLIYSLDVNSLYPSVMLKKLPYGLPKLFEGEYIEDKVYDMYIQIISCTFKLKKNMIPTIQIKGPYFKQNEYLESSNGEIVTLYLTNIDLDMLFKHYDVTNKSYHGGFKFKSIEGLFTDYIEFWTNVKIEAGKSGNKGLREIAKLQLNSLYGKFGVKPNVTLKIPYLENGIVKYKDGEKETRDSIYVPIASFITAYARQKTIETSQLIKEYSLLKYNKDMYIYSDTDSIHTTLPLEDIKELIQLDDYKLGYWANEGFFKEGIFIRQKCYLEIDFDNKLHITCAGLPKRCITYSEDENKYYYFNPISKQKEEFTKSHFKEGFLAGGKLVFKHVKGGVKLVETTYMIKPNDVVNSIKKLNKK